MDPNKNRGIASLTNLYKMYTNIICRKLYVWCDEFAILPDSQHGFRPQWSTKTAIQDLTYDIKFSISSKTPFYVCFVDFERAFDCISREKLMLKLSKFGCPSQTLAVFSDIYKDTQIQVRFGDSITRKIRQTRGVPQRWSIITPTFLYFSCRLIQLPWKCTLHSEFLCRWPRNWLKWPPKTPKRNKQIITIVWS